MVGPLGLGQILRLSERNRLWRRLHLRAGCIRTRQRAGINWCPTICFTSSPAIRRTRKQIKKDVWRTLIGRLGNSNGGEYHGTYAQQDHNGASGRTSRFSTMGVSATFLAKILLGLSQRFPNTLLYEVLSRTMGTQFHQKKSFMILTEDHSTNRLSQCKAR